MTNANRQKEILAAGELVDCMIAALDHLNHAGGGPLSCFSGGSLTRIFRERRKEKAQKELLKARFAMKSLRRYARNADFGEAMHTVDLIYNRMAANVLGPSQMKDARRDLDRAIQQAARFRDRLSDGLE